MFTRALATSFVEKDVVNQWLGAVHLCGFGFFLALEAGIARFPGGARFYRGTGFPYQVDTFDDIKSTFDET